MKKTTFVSLLVTGLLISPAVLAQHVQADQVSSTTSEETVALQRQFLKILKQ